MPPILAFCPECALLQTTAPRSDVVPDSAAAAELASDIVARLLEEQALDAHSLVLDPACGEGQRLAAYVRREIPVLGIEADRRRSWAARDAGVPTLTAVFDAVLGARLAAEGRRADVVHVHGALEQAIDVNDFVQGLKHVLEPSGVVIIEVADALEALERDGIGALRPEHLSHFTLTALDRVLGRRGLVVREVDRPGAGRLVAFADRRASWLRSAGVHALLRDEAAWGADRVERYRGLVLPSSPENERTGGER